MQNYIGNVVKSLRLKKNMTQKELAEGICTVKQLSRIEKNESSPSVYILSEISNKLGNDLLDYIPYSYDELGYDIKNEIDIVVGLYESYEYQKAFEYISESEFLKNCKSEYSRTLTDLIRGNLINYIGVEENVDENYYIELIKRTKNFEKTEEIFKENLRPLDYKILNSLIVEYLKKNEFEEAEKLLLLCIENYEKNYNKKNDSSYVRFLHNLSRLYFIQKRYKEGVKYSKKGIKQCLDNSNLIVLAELYNVCGRCLYKSGDKEEGKKYINNYIALSKMLNPEKTKEIIKTLIENYKLDEI